MRMQLETITPRKAADWLKRNINNRPLSEAFVGKLAAAQVAGQWQVNGDPIRFDSSGDLIDGQHRLTACIKSGVTIQSWVLRGVESKAFDTIDKGHVRTNGDVLARRGEKHYNMLAAACAHWWRYVNRNTSNCGSNTPRPDQLDELLAGVNGAAIRAGCEFASRFNRKTSLVTGSELAFFVSFANRLYGEGVANPFWEKVMTAEQLVRGSAEHTLFRRLSDSATGPYRLTQKTRMAICIKAFNGWLTKTPVKCLKYTDGEDFPQFVPKSKVKING